MITGRIKHTQTDALITILPMGSKNYRFNMGQIPKNTASNSTAITLQETITDCLLHTIK